MQRWAVFPAALCLMLLGGEAMDAAREALKVFAEKIMPALLPMMVLSRFYGMLPGGYDAKGLARLETIAFSFIAGSPAGAASAAELLQKDERFLSEAENLMAFCGVMSPLFFLGSLRSILGSWAGWVLLLCHWAGCLLTGLIISCSAKKPEPVEMQRKAAIQKPPASFPEIIASAMQGIISVLGAVLFFSIAAAVVENLLKRLFPALGGSGMVFAVLQALLEAGGGSIRVAVLGGISSLPLVCGLCSFGGLSIWMQCLMVTGKIIRPGRLLAIRLLHGALGYGICAAVIRFFPPGI